MDNYIKHEKGYCYISEEEEVVYIVNLFDYLVKHNVCQDAKILEALAQIKHVCKYSDDLGGYVIPILSYWVDKQKMVNHSNGSYSFDAIKANFLMLQNVHIHLKTLSAYIKKNKSLFNSLKTVDMAEFYNYEYFMFYYMSDKANEFCTENYNENVNYHWLNEESKKVQCAAKNHYPHLNFIQIHPQFIEVPNLNKYIKKWKVVLDEKGKPLAIDSATTIDHFNQGKMYAIFMDGDKEEEIKDGFLSANGYNTVCLSEAKLFNNEKKAIKFVNVYSSGVAICEIDLQFNKIVKKFGEVEAKGLDVVLSHQEKVQLESLDTVEGLASKLLEKLEGIDNPTLKEALSLLLEGKEVKKNVKRKI